MDLSAFVWNPIIKLVNSRMKHCWHPMPAISSRFVSITTNDGTPYEYICSQIFRPIFAVSSSSLLNIIPPTAWIKKLTASAHTKIRVKNRALNFHTFRLGSQKYTILPPTMYTKALTRIGASRTKRLEPTDHASTSGCFAPMLRKLRPIISQIPAMQMTQAKTFLCKKPWAKWPRVDIPNIATKANAAPRDGQYAHCASGS